jgi:hypothetical protein
MIERRSSMRRYEPRTPRATLAVTAIALSALVLGALVILPAEMSALTDDSAATIALTPAEAAARASDRSATHTSTSVLRCKDIGPEPAQAG